MATYVNTVPDRDTLRIGEARFPWKQMLWFGALLVICYAPVLYRLGLQWKNDEDMGHGFFVPVIAGFIIWQRREELMAMKLNPSRWGLVLVGVSGLFLIIATLGAELFTARLSFVFTLIGMVGALGGSVLLRN